MDLAKKVRRKHLIDVCNAEILCFYVPYPYIDRSGFMENFCALSYGNYF
jgi:hypothetical protein